MKPTEQIGEKVLRCKEAMKIRRHQWVTGSPVTAEQMALEPTPTFYELYTDKSGQVIDGHQIRVFLGNGEPRYAKSLNQQFITYRSDELTPVEGTEY